MGEAQCAAAIFPRIRTPNEQITWLMKGRFDYKFGTGEEATCEAGSLVLIPGGVEHEVWYREECEIVEFFSPPRTDMFPGLERQSLWIGGVASIDEFA